MNEGVDLIAQERGRGKSRAVRKRMPRWVVLTIILIVWIGIGYGGYTLARTYLGHIQQQLDQIAETNKTEIQELNAQLTALKKGMDDQKTQAENLQKKLAAVEKELTAVKDEMSLAGDSLSTTAETKKALNDRITDLSKELTELRKLVKRLEEAARVY
ncbi:hypothetical protein [Gorillibacterium timonense]|uniref:hypothetical protein n=1 Tax=Gorillibacterium timonense TaxID=1689269 RepID=UPI00071C7A5D|nr:hypothetical protein [Gorillibacterium timonense]